MGGPAPTSGGGPDEWLEMAKKCKYLCEGDMKRLCELVKECLMEGSAPHQSPTTRGRRTNSLRRIQHPTRLHTRHSMR